MIAAMRPEDISLWIVSFRRIPTLRRTISDWLDSFPFTDVNVIANDPATNYSSIETAFPQVRVWRNIFQSSWETGSIAWCWNQCMRHTFETRDWCLMSQDDVLVKPGWDQLITDDYVTYIAPIGDTIQLQSLAGFAATGWFDERFRAIGGPETDYSLRSLQACPDRVSIHDDHFWRLYHNDVGLAEYWRPAPREGEVLETRNAFIVPYERVEAHERWIAKWGEHVESLFPRRGFNAQRRPGWDEIDWYPSFTQRLRKLGRL
jgi:hypothetical protein